MADIFDELLSGNVPPEALVGALRRQKTLGTIGALSGDKTIARVGGATADEAMQSAYGLRDQRERDQARAENHAFALQQQQIANAQREEDRAARAQGLKQARELAYAQMKNARDIEGLKLSSAASKPKQTESYQRAQLLGTEMMDAEKQLRQIPGGNDAAISTAQRVLDSNPVTRGATSETFRRQQAAATRWSQNYLYMKSGASAPAEEVRKTELQYTPQWGDTPAVIAQKAAARTEAMKGVGKIYGLDVPDFDHPGGAAAPTDMDAYFKQLTGAK